MLIHHSILKHILGWRDGIMRGSFVITIILFGIFMSVRSEAGHILRYAYDADGNRTARTVILDRQAVHNNGNITNGNGQRSLLDRFGQIEITIFPNPTEGVVTVRINGGNDGYETANARIFRPDGSELSESDFKSETSFDLSGQTDGIYVMIIEIDGESQSYKIVKK